MRFAVFSVFIVSISLVAAYPIESQSTAYCSNTLLANKGIADLAKRQKGYNMRGGGVPATFMAGATALFGANWELANGPPPTDGVPNWDPKGTPKGKSNRDPFKSGC